jgi:hypothetical protein
MYSHCVFAHHYKSYSPLEPDDFECVYEGELSTPFSCDESDSCPAFADSPGRFDEDERV